MKKITNSTFDDFFNAISETKHVSLTLDSARVPN